jgi:hypothetical protein
MNIPNILPGEYPGPRDLEPGLSVRFFKEAYLNARDQDLPTPHENSWPQRVT